MHIDTHRSQLITVIGWIGTIILLTSYALNSFGIISSTGIIYGISNIIVAIFLGIRVSVDKNWSNLTLQVIFGIIAIINVFLYIFV